MSDNLIPLQLVNKLATSPAREPLYFKEVKSLDGKMVKLGDPQVTRALVALMNQYAVMGGAAAHWGGPAAFAEIMSALHGILFKTSSAWYNHFNFVNDAGHAENGIYALRANLGFDNLTFEDLKKFRSKDSKLTGHGEAHLNPEGVFISNGPLGSGLAQAQGLSIADKILNNKRTTFCTVSDGASMEGEAKEAMTAIAGLAKKNKINPFVMIISDNDTKLGGRISEDSFDMAPTFNALSELGWNFIKIESGHNLEKVFQGLEKAYKEALENPQAPVAVVVKTIKGHGVRFTEENKSGGHGHPLAAYDKRIVKFIKEIFDDQVPLEFQKWSNEILNLSPPNKNSTSKSIEKDKVQSGVASALIKAAEEGYPVYSVSSDLQGSTGAKGFQQKFPDRFLDVGIAESNMISTAIGLSKQGLIPVVDTFAQFGVTKGNLPLIMSQLSQGPIIALFSHTGFQDAADGASHQSTTYFSTVAGIPNTIVISLSCRDEAFFYMYAAIRRFKEKAEKGEVPESVIFFFGREKHPLFYVKDMKFEWEKAQVLVKGSDGVIVTSGPLVETALEAAQELEKEGKKITVINNPFINKIDVQTIGNALKENKNKLMTLEDHQLIGGAGSILVHSLKIEGYNFEVKSLGIKGSFGQSAYTAKDLYIKHGLDTKNVKSFF